MAPSRDPAHQRQIDQRVAKIQHAAGDLERSRNRLRRLVGEARGAGVTWSEIAAVLGISRQAVEKRYGTRGERADLLEAREARRALRSAQVAAQRAAASATGDDPWPDGTVQPALPEQT